MNHKANVVREIASQDHHCGISIAPLNVTIDGKQYVSRDWSIGCIRIHGFSRSVTRFDELDAQITVAFGDFKINVDTRIRVSCYDATEQELTAELFALDDKQQALLKYFSDSLICGKTNSNGEITNFIDTLGIPVSEKADPSLNRSPPRRRRFFRTLAMSSGYLLIGAFLTYYAANTLYKNVFKLRVDTAAITGPDLVIRAPISGVVDEIYKKIGDHVARDEPLFYISNDDMRENIELAKIEIRDARADLKEKEQKLKFQIEKLESYRKFGINRLQMAKARIAALKEKYRLVEKRHNRTTKLHAVGVASGEILDEVTESVVSLRSELEVAIVEEQIATRAIEETHRGRFFTDHRLEGEVGELRSAVDAAKERVVLEEERLKVFEARLHRLVVGSPVDGEVVSLYSNVHQIIEKGEPLLLIERDGERGIEAIVSAQELDSAMLNQSAKVMFRGRPHPLIAKVTSIERTGVQEVNQINVVGLDDNVFPPVRVKLTLTGNADRKSIASLPLGFPVTVEFSKRFLSSNFPLLASIADFFLSIDLAVEKQPNN